MTNTVDDRWRSPDFLCLPPNPLHRTCRAHRPGPLIILRSCIAPKGLSWKSWQDTILHLLAFRRHGWNIQNFRPQGSRHHVQNCVSMRKPTFSPFSIHILINNVNSAPWKLWNSLRWTSTSAYWSCVIHLNRSRLLERLSIVQNTLGMIAQTHTRTNLTLNSGWLPVLMTTYSVSVPHSMSGSLGAYRAVFRKLLIHWLLTSVASWFLTYVFGHPTYGEHVGFV